jgi:signal transduction histidine kinase
VDGPATSRDFFRQQVSLNPTSRFLSLLTPQPAQPLFVEWRFRHLPATGPERAILALGLDVSASMLERQQTGAQEEALREQVRHADRLATIGQLAAGIAHEINNPLTDILGFAQLAANSADLPEQTYADMIKIVQSALYAREVIKRILLFSRQTHPKDTLANLNAIVKDWKGFIEPRCSKNGITVMLDLHEPMPDIAGDASQLNQVLINLVTNAIHAMPQGGRLIIETAMRDQHAVLRVADTGVGIPVAIRDKIFLPFVTTKEVDQGTGLGLSVVYGIVQEHGGTIHLESVEGQGTAFEIRFPLAVNDGSKPRAS